MFQGDSLSVLLFLIGTSLAALMGAVVAQPGRARTFLWVLMTSFVVATFAWLAMPTASPTIESLKPLVYAVVRSGALVMVGTVGIVAIMLKRNPSPVSPTPSAISIDVIAALRSTKTDAQIALSNGGLASSERTLPKIEAALLSAHKQYQIPLLANSGNARSDLQRSLGLLEKIIPYLQQGHIEEAQYVASAYISSRST